MASGGRSGLRDDGLRCFVSSYAQSPPRPPSSFSTPTDRRRLGDDDDLSLRAMEDLCRMSFSDDGQIDSAAECHRRRGFSAAEQRWPGSSVVDSDGFVRPLLPPPPNPSLPFVGGSSLGRGDSQYVPLVPSSSSSLYGPLSLSTVLDSTHAASARPLPPPPPRPTPSSRRLYHPDAAVVLDGEGDGVVSGPTLNPLNAVPSTICVHSSTSNQLNELQCTLDNLPLLSDEEEANYLFLNQDLGSLLSSSFVSDGSDPLTMHSMFNNQYSVSSISSASAAEEPESKLVDYLLENGFSSGDSQRFPGCSSNIVNQQPAVANCSTTGSRKVLKASRRISKNKPASDDAPVSLQTSISKYAGDKPSHTKVSRYVIQCLTDFGFCVVDRYMGTETGTQILNEVKNLEMMGLFRDGQLISQTNDTQTIRGDKIVWVERDTKGLQHISVLIRQLDILMEGLNGQIGAYQIKSRSKAMVACYPGHGKGYMRHVDNATHDGRCITCIYYLNKDWNSAKDGGLLRMYPAKVPESVVNIEPNFDRLLLFWSDHRNPHEVQPAFRERHAITVWYFDSIERQRFLQQGMPDHHYKDNRLSPISLSCSSRSTTRICDSGSELL